MENVEKIAKEISDTMDSFGKINNEALFDVIRNKCEDIFNTKDIKEVKYTQSDIGTTCEVITEDSYYNISIVKGKYKTKENTEDKKKEAMYMHSKGLTQTLIGQTLGVSQKTISNWIKEHKNKNK